MFPRKKSSLDAQVEEAPSCEWYRLLHGAAFDKGPAQSPFVSLSFRSTFSPWEYSLLHSRECIGTASSCRRHGGPALSQAWGRLVVLGCMVLVTYCVHKVCLGLFCGLLHWPYSCCRHADYAYIWVQVLIPRQTYDDFMTLQTLRALGPLAFISAPFQWL